MTQYPLSINLFNQKTNKKRRSLTPSQRIYVWERPNIYSRTCSICHRKITKLSDLELDHSRAHSKGGIKLAFAHKDCNRLKSSGSLRQIQKRLGIKTKKGKTTKKKSVKRKSTNPWDIKPLKIKPLKMPSFRI